MKLEYTCESFHRNLYNLWRADKYCDIVLIGSDGKTRISGHRVVLDAFSPYIADQTVDTDGNMIKEINVTSIDGVILRRLVSVCYSTTLEVDEDNLSSIYKGAVHLQLNSLLPTIENYIMTQLNYENCMQFHDLAEMCNREELHKAIKNYICQHFIEIADQPFFMKLDVQKLKMLLAFEGLIVQSVEDVFRRVMKWIQYDTDGQRDSFFSELLPNLRLSSMPQKFLLECVKPLCKTIEEKDCFIAALQTKLLSIPSVLTDFGQSPVTVEQLIIVAGNFNKRKEIMEYSFEKRNWNTLAQLRTKVDNFSVIHYKVLNSLCFVGGCIDSALSDVLLWNLKTRQFTNLISMITPRRSPNVTSFNNGSDEDLIVVGGLGILLVEHWSSKSGKWNSLVPTKECTHGARLVAVRNLVYCIGGYYRRTSVQCYNLTEKCWSKLASLNHRRENCGILIDKGKIYVIGGNSDVIESYDLENDKWTEICTVEGSKAVSTCVRRHNNRFIAFGWNIVLTSAGDCKIWEKSNTIKTIDKDEIYSAFSIPRQQYQIQ